MKTVNMLLAALFAGSLIFTVSVTAMERKVEKDVKKGVVKAWRLGNTQYCHLKFPAIKPETLNSGNPELQDPKYAQLIDYYGPCTHDPLGEIEIERQKSAVERSHRTD